MAKYEAEAFDAEARAADLMQQYEMTIAALERPAPVLQSAAHQRLEEERSG